MVYELHLNNAVHTYCIQCTNIYPDIYHFLHLHCYYPDPSHHDPLPGPLQHSGQSNSVTVSSRLGHSAQSLARAPVSALKQHSSLWHKSPHALTSTFSPLASSTLAILFTHSQTDSLLTIPQVHQTCSYLRAFALAVPTARSVIPQLYVMAHSSSFLILCLNVTFVVRP